MGGRIRVSGTVKTVAADMAMVKPDPGASISANAMMIDAGSQFNGMPLDAFLYIGMALAGDWDERTLRFYPDFGDWTETRFLAEYPVGTVVLGLVAAVTRQEADVRLHPTLSVTMKRDEVSSNPKDVIERLWTVGDIVSVRVVRDPAGRLRLRHFDVDDDEPIADAPPVIEGGEPWLTKSKMDLIESTKELWERDKREADELTAALGVLSKQMQVGIDELSSKLGSLSTDTGEIPVVGSTSADDGLTPQERSLSTFTAKQIQRTLTNYKVELDKLAERNRGLVEALAAGRKREAGLADQAESLRGQLSRVRQELQDALKRDRSGSAESLSVAERRSRYGTVEEWIREEIRAFWIDNYTPDDRAKFPLDRQPWRVLPSFLLTFQALTDDGKDKAIKTATHIVTGRNAIEHITEDHPLREGDETSKPEVVREDGAASRRAYIESHTPQSRRLHYWKLRDGSIELSRVGLHDDFTP
jgi:hypothetical protein